MSRFIIAWCDGMLASCALIVVISAMAAPFSLYQEIKHKYDIHQKRKELERAREIGTFKLPQEPSQIKTKD